MRTDDSSGQFADPADPLSRAFQDAIADRLHTFLGHKRQQLAAVSPQLGFVVEIVDQMVAHGKRIRPAFGYWGYIAAGGSEDEQIILDAIAALELLHVGVLIHDDVLDQAATRRGLPTVHQRCAAWHRERAQAGDSEAFGEAMAVLAGDQLLVWSDQMLARAKIPASMVQAVRFFHLVRTEVNTGQMLDICAQYGLGIAVGDGATDPEDVATAVLDEKTSRYTVQRPVQFGAAAAGASDTLLETLGEFGLYLGRAFQLRDDLLGIFGDADVVGKTAGDLQEGKQTVVIARTYRLADRAQRKDLDLIVGNPELGADGIARARQIITDTGALASVEASIDTYYQRSLAALDRAEICDVGRQGLANLASQCVNRVR